MYQRWLGLLLALGWSGPSMGDLGSPASTSQALNEGKASKTTCASLTSALAITCYRDDESSPKAARCRPVTHGSGALTLGAEATVTDAVIGSVTTAAVVRLTDTKALYSYKYSTLVHASVISYSSSSWTLSVGTEKTYSISSASYQRVAAMRRSPRELTVAHVQ